MQVKKIQNSKIAIIGLGYVGLPLAVAFSKKYPVIGFDINPIRVRELNDGYDRTREVGAKDLLPLLRSSVRATLEEKGFFATGAITAISDCNVYIVTVPTPIDDYKRPVLDPLEKASETVGRILKPGDTVIYESTVYPGVTEECCMPVLERVSGLEYNVDFFVGYSPERINPGDKEHTVTKILKVTSGSTPEAAEYIDQLYGSVIEAGTHRAPSIKVAEAAKVIENTQRDINIAFVNELSMIFNRIGIDTHEVLAAAATKWNFLPFKPGLVGGHCIGVDPYYLAHKAQEVGYHPEILLAGRRLNDSMGRYVAGEVVKQMIKKGIPVNGGRALILGITFKENCPDIRNTKVVDIYHELKSFGLEVDIHDPWADVEEVKEEYQLPALAELNGVQYDAVILAVAHDQFKVMDLEEITNGRKVIYDVKAVLDPAEIVTRL